MPDMAAQMQKLAEFDRPTGLGNFKMTSYLRNGAYAFALSRGTLPVDDLMVRIQSPCLFGESFGVNSCDCAEQLQLALKLGSEADSFLLVYLMDQEGRGLGLFQKIKAIEAEANNDIDMVEAFKLLGLPLDLREYGAAADVIRDLNGDRPIRLMTNNPKKVAGLEEHGISIPERLPLLVSNPSDACRRYLRSKKREMGHLLPDF